MTPHCTVRTPRQKLTQVGVLVSIVRTIIHRVTAHYWEVQFPITITPGARYAPPQIVNDHGGL